MGIDFAEIEFAVKGHKYSYHGEKLRSVTKIIGTLEPAFGGDPAITAKKKGKTVEQVQAEWDAKGDAGRTKGTQVHQYAEDVMSGRLNKVLRHVNTRLPEYDAVDSGWIKMQELGAVTIEKEMVVGDAEFKVAGTIDLLTRLNNLDHPNLSIVDWKTGKYSDTSGFGRLKKPFSFLANCEHAKYSLQISLYRLIYERNMDEELGDCFIMHLSDTGKHTLYLANDFRPELTEWLEKGGPSDPDAEVDAQTAISAIGKLDSHVVSGLSQETIRDLTIASTSLSHLIDGK